MPWRLVVTNGWKSWAVISGADAGTGIGDGDFDHVVGRRRGRDDKFAALGILHRLDGIAHQIEQDLLNLHLVGQHEVDARIELEAHAHAFVLGADQRERARLLDELLDALPRAARSRRGRRNRASGG